MPRLMENEMENEQETEESDVHSSDDNLDSIPSKQVKAVKVPAPTKATPKKSSRKSQVAEPEPESEEDDEVTPQPDTKMRDVNAEGKEEEDDDEEVYTVEKIMDHGESEEGVFILKVKWEGYDKKDDMTWETEQTLRENASEAVEAYYAKFGGRRPDIGEKPLKAKKGSKRQSETTESNGAPAAKKRRGVLKKDEGDTKLPVGNWENHIQLIHTISDQPGPEADPDIVYKEGQLHVLIAFNSGARTSVTVEHMRQKAPQKLIDFFLEHLSFGPANESSEVKKQPGKRTRAR